MSATGLDVFDKTLQTTHVWLGEIMDRLGEDRQLAWKALSAVLRVLRDRLPVELAAHLGSQLPLLVRGAYYDRFMPERMPSDLDRPEEFAEAVAAELGDAADLDPEDAIAIVFATLERHVTEGQLAKVRQALPRPVAMLWDGADQRQLIEVGA